MTDFFARQRITRFADNFKTAIVVILMLSVVAFSVIGDKAVKPYILDWAAFMVALVITALIMDAINHFKIKKAGL